MNLNLSNKHLVQSALKKPPTTCFYTILDVNKLLTACFQHCHIKEASALHSLSVYNVHIDLFYLLFLFTHIYYYIKYYEIACK